MKMIQRVEKIAQALLIKKKSSIIQASWMFLGKIECLIFQK